MILGSRRSALDGMESRAHERQSYGRRHVGNQWTTLCLCGGQRASSCGQRDGFTPAPPGVQIERTDEIVRAADVVVTMGCGGACPIFPGKRYEDWDLDDPAGKGVELVRPIRDEIGRRVRKLLAELDVPTSKSATPA
jgi:hypothetical protein